MIDKAANRTLRVIGGDWRRRAIEFPAVQAIRPTPDRVRETLFNWLQGELFGARCLEPFAGSGILSFEALSRGAAHCTIIDQSRQALTSIETNLQLLGADAERFHTINTDGYLWLHSQAQQQQSPFDIVFLDPPFKDERLQATILSCLQLISAEGYLYVESPQAIPAADEYDIYRQKRAGAVHYALLTRDG